MKRLPQCLCVIVTLVIVSNPVFAQVTKDPQAPAETPAPKIPVVATASDAPGEVVQMSPFVIKASSDNLVQESTSGRDKMVQELRSDIKLIARTIAALGEGGDSR